MKAIIINRMYAGEYLTKGVGGGETINLLHADDGKNYSFINPYGIFNPKYNDKVVAVLHTRLHEAGCFEVIGVSVIGKNGQLVHPKGYTFKDKISKCSTELKEYAKHHSINYGGVPYIKEKEEWVPISFVSEKLLYPKEPIYILDSHYEKEICDNLTSFKLPDKRFAKQSLLMYVDDVNNPKAYDEVIKMINNKDLWEERITKLDSLKYNNHFNFLSLIGKEDDELSFSNMFSYFFSNYRNLFKSFAKDILKVNIDEDHVIRREFHNIDLWIEDKDDVIVIENKIKSGINGISPRHDFNEGGLVQSQLSKYYELATSYAKENNKKVLCFIFIPNYNKLDLSIYEGSKLYKEIKYRDIYNYLIKQSVDDKYYTDFLNALYKHTKAVPVDYSEQMMNYLIKKVNKEKNKN